MRTRTAMIIILLLPVVWMLAVLGCEPDNTNDVGCLQSDCTAACQRAGRSGGSCTGDICICAEPDNSSYDWQELDGGDSDNGGDADTDTDTDTDTDSDSDADANADADTDTAPDTDSDSA